jgi:hypothetical protein
MATEQKYHRAQLGGNGLPADAAWLTSESTDIGRPANARPRVITLSTLHTFRPLCSVQNDLKY